MRQQTENWLMRILVFLYAVVVFSMMAVDIYKNHKAAKYAKMDCKIEINEIASAECIIFNTENHNLKNDTIKVSKDILASILDAKNYSEGNGTMIKGMFYPLYQFNLIMINNEEKEVVFSFMNGEVRIKNNNKIEQKLQMCNPSKMERLFDAIQ